MTSTCKWITSSRSHGWCHLPTMQVSTTWHQSFVCITLLPPNSRGDGWWLRTVFNQLCLRGGFYVNFEWLWISAITQFTSFWINQWHQLERIQIQKKERCLTISAFDSELTWIWYHIEMWRGVEFVWPGTWVIRSNIWNWTQDFSGHQRWVRRELNGKVSQLTLATGATADVTHCGVSHDTFPLNWQLVEWGSWREEQLDKLA